jgi:hypothetical protein
MLAFNPQERATCRSLLKSSVFDGVRNKELEDFKGSKIRVPSDITNYWKAFQKLVS